MTVSDLVHSSYGGLHGLGAQGGDGASWPTIPSPACLTVAELSRRANVSGQSTLRFHRQTGLRWLRRLSAPPDQRAQGRLALAGGAQGSAARAAPGPALSRAAGRADAAGERGDPGRPQRRWSSRRSRPSSATAVGRSTFSAGGSATASRSYFYVHLRQIRPKVHHVPSFHEDWPDTLLRLKRGDLLVLFDFRRYQRELLAFAEQASPAPARPTVVLFTDKWMSPIARISSHILPIQVEVGTPWDTAGSSGPPDRGAVHPGGRGELAGHPIAH